jgi:hypothetical protein
MNTLKKEQVNEYNVNQAYLVVSADILCIVIPYRKIHVLCHKIHLHLRYTYKICIKMVKNTGLYYKTHLIS